MASHPRSSHSRRSFASGPSQRPISGPALTLGPELTSATGLPPQSRARFGPHVLRLRGAEDTPSSTDSSGDERGSYCRPSLQLMGVGTWRPRACSDASSQTDMASLPDHLSLHHNYHPHHHYPFGQPGFYWSPLQEQGLSDNMYFRSNLSDKMSDYEDIWRSSHYDADSVRYGSIRGGGTFDLDSSMTAQSDFSNFFVVGGDRDGVVSPTTPATAASPEMSQPSAQSGPQRHEATEASLPPSAASLTSTGDSTLTRQFGRLSRLRSSSESSLATVASPVYAEPADAVKFRHKESQFTRGVPRRRSAPTMSSDNTSTERGQRHRRSEQNVGKEELADLWGEAKDHTGSGRRTGRPSSSPQRDSVSPHRQSWHQSQDSGKPGPKRAGWQERFNRLKLGNKMVGQDTASTHSLQSTSLDDSLFVVEETPPGPSAAPSLQTLHKFPVFQQQGQDSCTAQDIMAYTMPELTLDPPHAAARRLAKPLSEYDNLNPYAPPSASSYGTTFCKPWEGGVVGSLIRSSASRLPPAMDLQERVQKWQEANRTFHHQHHHHSLQQQQIEEEETASLFQPSVPQHAFSMPRAMSRGHSGVTSADPFSLHVTSDRGHSTMRPRPSQQPGSASQHRPQSMYHRPAERSGHKRGQVQLMRSLSNPGQPYGHPTSPRSRARPDQRIHHPVHGQDQYQQMQAQQQLQDR